MALVAPVPVAVATIPLWDPRLAAPPPAFGVKLGAGSIAAQSYQAVTATSSQHVFNVQVPSLQTYVDRYVLWRTTVQIQWYTQFSAALQPTVSGLPLCMPGRDWALAAWPLHRLATNLSLQVNDTSVQLNLSQCLALLLRLNDSAEGRSITTTPSKLDVYALNSTNSQTVSSPYGGIDTAPYGVDAGNGAFPFLWCVPSFATTNQGKTLLSIGSSGSYTDGTFTTNWANGIPVTTAGLSYYPLAIQVSIAENLLISPFESGSSAAGPEGAIWGISNFVYQAQMQSPDAARVLRCLSACQAFTNISYGYVPFANTTLDFNLLSAPLTLYVPPRNEVPYQQFIAFPFTSSGAINAGTQGTPNTGDVSSNVITLAQIPELLCILCTPPNYGDVGTGTTSRGTGVQTCLQGDWFYPVRKVNITCCNYNGLLTNVTKYTLWRMTTQNGLRMPWLQWAGYALRSGDNGQACTTAQCGQGLQPTGYLSVPAGSPTLMTGGPLILAMGKDVQLDPTLAPGVSGNYALQAIVTVENGTASSATPTVTLIVVNAGFFNSKAGSSSVTTAPLTTDNVLEASKQIKLNGGATLTSGQIDRVVGAGWNDKLSTGVMGARHFYEAGKPVEAAGHAAAAAAGGGYGSGGSMVPYSGGGARTGGAAARW